MSEERPRLWRSLWWGFTHPFGGCCHDWQEHWWVAGHYWTCTKCGKHQPA